MIISDAMRDMQAIILKLLGATSHSREPSTSNSHTTKDVHAPIYNTLKPSPLKAPALYTTNLLLLHYPYLPELLTKFEHYYILQDTNVEKMQLALQWNLYSSNKKAIIIHDFEKLNIFCVNALLKLCEDNTCYVIGLTNSYLQLPAAILSRFLLFKFPEPAPKLNKELLQKILLNPSVNLINSDNIATLAHTLLEQLKLCMFNAMQKEESTKAIDALACLKYLDARSALNISFNLMQKLSKAHNLPLNVKNILYTTILQLEEHLLANST